LVQPPYAADDGEELVGQGPFAPGHVCRYAGDVPPLQERAPPRLGLEDPEEDKILGVDVGVADEKGVELGVTLRPGEARAGDTGWDNLVIEVGPGLAACRCCEDRGHAGAPVCEGRSCCLCARGRPAGGRPLRLREGDEPRGTVKYLSALVGRGSRRGGLRRRRPLMRAADGLGGLVVRR